MPESLRTRVMRWRFNLLPAYRGTGARLEYIDANLREVRVRVPLSWRTRNLNGTVFGGSIFGAVEAIPAVMLTSHLGRQEYVGWTKEASVQFKRQARTDLTARIVLSAEEVETTRSELVKSGRVERRHQVDLHDEVGAVCATCHILVHLHVRGRPEMIPAPAELSSPAG